MISSRHDHSDRHKRHKTRWILAISALLALILATLFEFPDSLPGPIDRALDGISAPTVHEGSEVTLRAPDAVRENPPDRAVAADPPDRTAPSDGPKVAHDRSSDNPADTGESAESISIRFENPADTSDQREETDEEPELRAIWGSVLDEAGAPLPGITVSASTVAMAGASGRQAMDTAVTDRLGMFEFAGMEAGEYRLSVAETERFHSSQAIVRAGAASAELRLRPKGSIRVHGQVTAMSTGPLKDVRIRALGETTVHRSDADGQYGLQVDLNRSESSAVLDFSLPGFRTQRKRVPPADDSESIRIDVEMQPENSTVSVFGRINGPGGEPIEGAEVSLASASPRAFHRTRSGAGGEYRLSEVETGERYRLDVDTGDAEYRRFTSGLFAVGPADTPYDVTLEAGGQASLSGTIVRPDGSALPDFTIWLRNTDLGGARPVVIRSDGRGRFGDVPVGAGTLSMESRSSPRLEASGILLGPGEHRVVEVPFDWGNRWLLGRVVDERGNPVARAEIAIHWERQYLDVRSRSSRRTASDASGFFSFSNLGADRYMLTCTAPGFQTARLAVPAGTDDELSIMLMR